jgi:hypothetical protein
VVLHQCYPFFVRNSIWARNVQCLAQYCYHFIPRLSRGIFDVVDGIGGVVSEEQLRQYGYYVRRGAPGEILWIEEELVSGWLYMLWTDQKVVVNEPRALQPSIRLRVSKVLTQRRDRQLHREIQTSAPVMTGPGEWHIVTRQFCVIRSFRASSSMLEATFRTIP